METSDSLSPNSTIRFWWQEVYVYNHDKNEIEMKPEIDSFCLSDKNPED
jgi:hypothetical protein